ncbi:MAG: TolC family protein [Gemmataceae bacterium]|nr:TolC family protein [Gemmataceae bacterium]
MIADWRFQIADLRGNRRLRAAVCRLRLALLVLVAGLCAAGCVGPRSGGFGSFSPLPALHAEATLPNEFTPATPAGPKAWDVDQLLALAAARHPDLAIAQARTEAAQGQWTQAGLFPNPLFGWEADSLGHQRNGAGSQGPIYRQEFVTGGKLRLAQAAAEHGVSAAEWQAVTRWFELATRVRLGFVEALTAQAEFKATDEVVRLAEESLGVAQKLLKAGVGAQPDVLQADVELNESKLRRDAARRREQAAWKLLAAAVGVAELPPAPLNGSLQSAIPEFAFEKVRETMRARSSILQEARAKVLQAEQHAQRAEAERIPNVHMLVQPFYDFPDKDWRMKLEAGVALPVFNRNQGNVQTALADLARARHEDRQAELRLDERLAVAFQRYQTARTQTDAYAKAILPSAKESLRLVRLGYERGDAKYDYAAVLQAQRTLAQAELSFVQALGDLWKAVAEIRGLLQEGPKGSPGKGQ